MYEPLRVISIVFVSLMSGALSAEEPNSTKVYISHFDIIDPVTSIADGVSSESIQVYLDEVHKGFHREMSLKEIREVAKTVTQFYQNKGYPFTRAYLGPQEITDGVASLRIFPGKLIGVRITGNKNYQSTQLEAPFSHLIGKPVKIAELEKALDKVNDFPGLMVTGYFSRKAKSGGTLINVEIKEEHQGSTFLRYDNYGQESTGEDRALIGVSAYNLFNRADQLDLLVQKSLGDGDSTFGSLGYKAPLWRDELTGQMQFYRSEFFVGDDVLLNNNISSNSRLELKGELNGIGSSINYALYNARDFKWGFNSAFDYRQVENIFELDGQDILSDSTDDKYSYWTVAIGTNTLKRNVFSNANAVGSANIFYGKTNDDSTPDENFIGIKVSGLGIFSLSDTEKSDWYQGVLQLKLNAQYSEDVLPPAERGAVVGNNAVGAYEPGLYFGDSIAYLGVEYFPKKLEIEYQALSVKPYAFYEHAYGSKNRSSTDSINIDASWVEFSGAGMGIQLQLGSYLEGRVEWATPIDKEGLVNDSADDDNQVLAELSLTYDF